MRGWMRVVAVAATAVAAGAAAPAAAETVSVLTPYLSAVATGEMVETFKADAAARGWTVSVVDTAGDFGALASRVEDVVNARTGAIVLVSINPAQIQDQVGKAAAAGIPVFAVDGATGPGVTLNVTSDNHALGKTMTDHLFGRLGGRGTIVRFFHSAHPGVHQREIALDEALEATPGIRQVADHYVQVPGQIDDSRNAMEAMLAANPAPGAINAVWAAWDEPGIGALLALQAAGRSDIVIAGIDGNPQAVELIRQCTPFIATVRQNFADMARITAEQMAKVFAGGKPDAAELYAPGTLITRESLGVACP
ncbi:substrate-binding domain-containing protein [Inquilinus limosus]|uniref:substrate-binding domain-containing protein n=1 Tax=Inquilinus limosus TaxID=171674 RepID=UPI00041F1638|nr:substrate-binding domain-containing protein [Inquilinus limosus]